MRAAYLIAGDDQAKIDSARARLRDRAERDGGSGALEVIDPAAPGRGPDAGAVLGAFAAMSLTPGRRFVLADGVERWTTTDAERVGAALAHPPPATTLVLIARGKPPPKLKRAVEDCGGEVLVYKAPRDRDVPAWLVREAKARGLVLEPAAARILAERMGTGLVRLSNELDRLALWAGDGGRVDAADLEAVSDTSTAAIWALSDALVDRSAPDVLSLGERLIAQRESVTHVTYTVAARLRQAVRAVAELEDGRSPKQVETSLDMHPYAAKKLVSRVRTRSAGELRQALGALADLELWCRGGSHYTDELALTLALRRSAGVAVDAP
jgi:DNA polymerase-3 subunit delta